MQLAEVVAALDVDWPARLAEPWDAVGLVVGDPGADVTRVLFAIDPTEAVAEEALALGADLLVTHHPLYLRGTSTVAATTPKGRLVHALIRGGCGLFVAHTNADSAIGGVNDALSDVFGLLDATPLEPQSAPALDKLTVFVPVADAERLRTALADAGAGQLGDYDRCAWTGLGEGTYRPLAGADPAIGEVGRLEVLPEARVEVVFPQVLRTDVLTAMRVAHPYEMVAFDLMECVAQPSGTGLGRVGQLPSPMRLAALTELADQLLPRTAWGVRAAGAADRLVHRLAVCGGSGDSLLGAAAAAGADAYLTSDLRHHSASEAPEGLALLDAAHWATEWPWLSVAAARLAMATGVATHVSSLVTDPFCLHSKGTA